MAAGRPTKYDPKFVEKASEYLAWKQDVITDGKLKVQLPTIEGFAAFIGVNKTTLYEWEKDHPEFSNALTMIRTEQQERLLNSGLSGDYNPTIAKLVLSANHGMREKSEQDITSGGQAIAPVLVKFIDGKDN